MHQPVREWFTFQGKKVTLQTIDHQHLSNCYWYLRVICNIPAPELKYILDECDERFNGQLLPYRPHTKFIEEIEYLEKLGCLLQVENGYNIIFNNVIIGNIIIPL